MSSLQLSYSSISEFQTCPRKWYYNRALRRSKRSHGDRSLGFGTAFHAAQEVLWGSEEQDQQTKLKDCLRAWNTAADGEGLGFEDRLLGEVLLIGYSIRWDDFRLTHNMLPIVEERAVVPVLDLKGNPDPELMLCVVFDVRCFDEDGQTVVVEHKTTTSPLDEGAPYWQRMDQSQQVSLYYLALSDNGHQVGHVVLDAVRAPKTTRLMATPVEKREFYVKNGSWGKAGDPKPGTRLVDETAQEFATRIQDMVLGNPNAFYARHKLYRDEFELERTRADLWMQGQLMKRCVDENLFPRNFPEACMKFNRECQYLPVCKGEVDIEDERVYRIRPKERDESEDLWK